MSSRQRHIWLLCGFGFSCALAIREPLAAAQNLSKFQRSFRLPRALALVTGANIPDSRRAPDFILIQDTHGNPQAQALIAALLIHAYHHWGVRKVFLEGAFAPVKIDRYRKLPEEIRRTFLEKLVLQGRCTGAEMAAVLLADSDSQGDPYLTPFQLVGNEDPQFYAQDLAIYEQVQAGQERALQALEAFRRLLTGLSIPPDHLLLKQIELTERLIALKLTPELYRDYLINKDLTPSLPEIKPVVRAAEEFYRLANVRSLILLEEASRKLPAWQGPRVIVAGGFHTEDMVAALRSEGKTYIVLTPNLSMAAIPQAVLRTVLKETL